MKDGKIPYREVGVFFRAEKGSYVSKLFLRSDVLKYGLFPFLDTETNSQRKRRGNTRKNFQISTTEKYNLRR